MHHDDPWRRLLHRWLVEYNPIYLLSAALVLGGMFLVSKEWSPVGGIVAPLVVASIAEAYALALVGGAALLTRIGLRRPGVMLGLLTMLYQCDLTLHTEASANLGAAGVVGSIVWASFFVAKLRGVTWALHLRLSRGATATLTLGAIGLAVWPHVAHDVSDRAGAALVVLWITALVTLQRSASVTSKVPLDAWGQTVLRRSVLASWGIVSVAVGLHLVFWVQQSLVQPGPLLAVIPLLSTRFIRRERPVWFVVVATLFIIGLRAPASFSATALVAAIMLALRARLAADLPVAVAAPASVGLVAPYRAFGEPVAPLPSGAPVEPVMPGGPVAAARLLVGAGVALYLSAWTFAWSHGPFPAHILALDAIAIGLALVIAWRRRTFLVLAPAAVDLAHALVELRVLSAPRSLAGWGVGALILGFALLIASVAVSYWLRRSIQRDDGRPS